MKQKRVPLGIASCELEARGLVCGWKKLAIGPKEKLCDSYQKHCGFSKKSHGSTPKKIMAIRDFIYTRLGAKP